MCKYLCEVLHHVLLLFSKFFFASYLLICKNVPYYQHNSYSIKPLVLYSTYICKKHDFSSKTTEPVIADLCGLTIQFYLMTHSGALGISLENVKLTTLCLFYLFFHCL